MSASIDEFHIFEIIPLGLYSLSELVTRDVKQKTTITYCTITLKCKIRRENSHGLLRSISF